MEDNKNKKEYELAFLVGGADDGLGVEKLLNQFKAEIFYHSPMANISLSYPIKKRQQAYFGFIQFKTSPEMAEKLMPAVKMSPFILRALLVSSFSSAKKSERSFGAVVEPAKEESARGRRSSERLPSSVSAGKVLTNEALEEKLEEILK